MALSERHQKIIDFLKIHGILSVNELSTLLNVSNVTVRKDLNLLEDKQYLFRTHGSAVLKNPFVKVRSISEKSNKQISTKQALGIKAKEYIAINDAIILGGGSTIGELSKLLDNCVPLTVLTPGLNVALNLSKHKGMEVIMPGGIVSLDNGVLVGEMSEHVLSQFSFTKCFIGSDGVDLSYGVTATNSQEAGITRQLMKHADKTILVCDSSKFGQKGYSKICDVEAIDLIITDTDIPSEIKNMLQKKGITIICVGN